MRHTYVAMLATLTVFSPGCGSEGEVESKPELETQSRWVLVDSTDAIQVALDAKTLGRTDSARITTWVRASYANALPGIVATQQRAYSVSLMHIEFDCVGRRDRILQTTFRDSAGTIVGSINDATEWERVVPESNAEVLVDSACALASTLVK